MPNQVFYSICNDLRNAKVAAAHDSTHNARESIARRRRVQAASITRRLRDRLLKFAIKSGARRAQVDLSGPCPVLRAFGGSKVFSVEIDGAAHSWHDALDRIALSDSVEAPAAGLLRFLGSQRLAPLQPAAGGVTFGAPLDAFAVSMVSRPVREAHWQTHQQYSDQRSRTRRIP